MPRFKKTVTIEVPQSAMALFEHLVEEEGYELAENPITEVIVVDEDVDDDDYDDEDDDDPE